MGVVVEGSQYITTRIIYKKGYHFFFRFQQVRLLMFEIVLIYERVDDLNDTNDLILYYKQSL